MPDPRARDPRFPDRPTHEDFVRLSEAVQTHDAMAEQLGVNPFAITGVDEESLTYVIKQRFGIFSQVGIAPTGADRAHLRDAHPFLMALYLDAFALGKRFAEQAQESPTRLTDLPTSFLDRLVEAAALASSDPVKTDLELTCRVCGEHLCDIEHDDTMEVLVSTVLAHTHEEGK